MTRPAVFAYSAHAHKAVRLPGYTYSAVCLFGSMSAPSSYWLPCTVAATCAALSLAYLLRYSVTPLAYYTVSYYYASHPENVAR